MSKQLYIDQATILLVEKAITRIILVILAHNCMT